jgi:hypothetical protein
MRAGSRTWTPDHVGGVDTPKRAYHGTSLEDAQRILRHGLEPRRVYQAKAKPDDFEPPVGVFMASEWWPAMVRARTRGHDGLVLVVKVKGLPLVRCRTPMGFALIDTYVSLDPIPAKRVVQVRDQAGTVVWKRKKKK